MAIKRYRNLTKKKIWDSFINYYYLNYASAEFERFHHVERINLTIFTN
jgi:hypothetical protein